jgi:hypothetical protein
MDTLQLRRMLTRSPCNNNKIHIIPFDQLPSKKIPPENSAFCVNTDNKEGVHWVGFFTIRSNEKNIVLCFDSLGFRTPVQKHYAQFMPFLKLFDKVVSNSEETLQHEDYVSTSCGLFVIFFLTEMCKGTRFSDFLKLFRQNTDYNECLVLSVMYSEYSEQSKDFKQVVGCRI